MKWKDGYWVVLAFLAGAVTLWIFFGTGWLEKDALPETKEGTNKPTAPNEANLHAPSGIGSPQWVAWFQKLPQAEQIGYLLQTERSLYPKEANRADWDAVKVSPGRGTGSEDYFPCKVLTDYKPLLQVRQGIGVVGLQFALHREGNSILTSIWAPNAKSAITVDWLNEKVLPATITNSTPGAGLVPEHIPDGMILMGGNGEIGISVDMKGGMLPWMKGFRAYPLALDRNEKIAFGDVYREKPLNLESIICMSIKPIKILGEVKMPISKTGLWCIYDTKQRLLLVAEHEWNWIALIDFAKPNEVASKSIR